MLFPSFQFWKRVKLSLPKKKPIPNPILEEDWSKCFVLFLSLKHGGNPDTTEGTFLLT